MNLKYTLILPTRILFSQDPIWIHTEGGTLPPSFVCNKNLQTIFLGGGTLLSDFVFACQDSTSATPPFRPDKLWLTLYRSVRLSLVYSRISIRSFIILRSQKNRCST